jgi:quinol monooxygenase YgiN
MLVVFVHVQVKPDCIEAFKAASIANAKASLAEPGIVQFDVIQQEDDPARFILVEVYRSEQDIAAHKQTKHYDAWRQTVENMVVGERTKVRYRDIWLTCKPKK